MGRIKEKYPWLDPSDERKYMTDRDILEKYIDLEKLCLTERERREVMDILYKYKGAFTLRDEIGTCPNIEVEIDVMDKSPFFYKALPFKRGRQNTNRQGNEMFMLLRHLERRFFSLL